MKFWQLVSGFREEREMLDAVFADGDWGKFNHWYTEFDSLVDQQSRTVLDTVIPGSLARTVASRSTQTFSLTSDGTLRLARSDSDGETLAAIDVLERFGGAVIEDVREYGSVRVDA